MKHYKISRVLNNSTVSKFVTNKWIEVNDSSSGQYIRFTTPILRSGLCDCSDTYIFVKWRIMVTVPNVANRKNKKLICKNNAPFGSYISKINSTFMEYTEDFDIVMPMNNLLEYKENCSISSGSLWN